MVAVRMMNDVDPSLFHSLERVGMTAVETDQDAKANPSTSHVGNDLPGAKPQDCSPPVG